VRPRRRRSSSSASSPMAGKRPAPRTSRTHDATTAPGGPAHCPRGDTVAHAWSRSSFSGGRGGRGQGGGPPPPPPPLALPALTLASPSSTDHPRHDEQRLLAGSFSRPHQRHPHDNEAAAAATDEE
jgi:hypothetical protein